jgi:hypothetical protein
MDTNRFSQFPVSVESMDGAVQELEQPAAEEVTDFGLSDSPELK